MADLQGPRSAVAPGPGQARGLPAARGTGLASVPAAAPRCCAVKVSEQSFRASSPRYAHHTGHPFAVYHSGVFSVWSGVTTISRHNMAITPERNPGQGAGTPLNLPSPWQLLSTLPLRLCLFWTSPVHGTTQRVVSCGLAPFLLHHVFRGHPCCTRCQHLVPFYSKQHSTLWL